VAGAEAALAEAGRRADAEPGASQRPPTTY